MMLLKDPCPLCQDILPGAADTAKLESNRNSGKKCMMLGADFGFGQVWTRTSMKLLSFQGDLVGKPIIGMVNLEPVDGNEFLLFGFERAQDGLHVPLSIHCPSPGLPPAGAHLV